MLCFVVTCLRKILVESANGTKIGRRINIDNLGDVGIVFKILECRIGKNGNGNRDAPCSTGFGIIDGCAHRRSCCNTIVHQNYVFALNVIQGLVLSSILLLALLALCAESLRFSLNVFLRNKQRITLYDTIIDVYVSLATNCSNSKFFILWEAY